ncbi:MAG: metalloregulator ArsR/SmtB family transcription factor [Trueperaceae bacterium]|nr:metalloregulator ArsR/SmtB family transcription factor [Trueperaceae bacterium]
MTVAERIHLLTDQTRWKIAQFLMDPVQSCCGRDDGVCGCDIETFLGVAQPTVSYHMRLLAEAGFVVAERRGRWVYYELAPAGLHEVAGELTRFADRADTVVRDADGIVERAPAVVRRSS